MPKLNFKKLSANTIRKGEPFVWVTSTGLTVSLIMIAFLLGLIIFNGLNVFWPKRVVQIELKPEFINSGINDAPLFAGEITKQQKKATNNNQESKHEEWQLFVGNRDAYGVSFKFIDFDQIKNATYPGNLMMIERWEYGDAIGAPVNLTLKDGKKIAFEDANFLSALRALVEEAGRRRQKIEKIEKKEIGAINEQMERLRILEKPIKALASVSAADENKLKNLDDQISQLQTAYDILASSAQELRAKQEEVKLTYHLVTGENRELPMGQFVHYYFPNQLSFSQRVGLFFKNFWVFLKDDPREANTEGGIFPAIFGTLVMTILMSVAVTPFGVLAAIYLREYAKQGAFVRAVRISVNNLAGVPSIVFGIFGVGFFVYFLGSQIDQWFFKDYLPTPTFGTGGILWAALTLALMTVPVVIVSTEEALAAVPRGMREGSLACGASKWQTIRRIILPASAPGILTGLILAMARGAGEVAPLMLVGVVKLAPSLPIDGKFPFFHLDQKFMHLGFHIYDLGFQSPDSEAAKPMVFATTLFLIMLVVLLNLTAIIVREKLRKRYSTGVF